MDPAHPESNPKHPVPVAPGSLPPRISLPAPGSPRKKPRRASRFLLLLLVSGVALFVWRARQAHDQRERFPGRGRGWEGTPFQTTPEVVRRSRVRSQSGGDPFPHETVQGPRSAVPSFAKAGGVYTESASVELVAAVPGATIRYTTDGSEPTTSSTLYAAPFSLSTTTLVKAKEFQAGTAPSPTVSETYTFVDSSVKDFTSNLPLVVINPFGQPVMKDQGVAASLRIVGPKEGAARTALLGKDSEYEGRCEIKLRGYSSLRFPKHSYTIKMRDDTGTSRKTTLLGMPEESDWVLYAPYSDKTLMRDVLAYELSNKMGRWAAHTRFVEVFMNRGGGKLTSRDYIGVYVLEEKIKRDKNRVHIKKLTPDDNAEPEISGGYIVKRDHLDHPHMEGPWGMFNGNQGGSDDDGKGFTTGRGLHLFFVEPKEKVVTAAQRRWIENYFNRLENALYGSSFKNPETGYAKYLDVDSFIDQFWIVELSKNVDGFRYSCFMTKDRNGKLRFEPIWDWNLSFGNANYHDGSSTENWYWPLIRESEVSWYRRLRQDPDFVQRLTDRWFELRHTVFRPEAILKRVDELAGQLDESQQRNFGRWRVLGQFVNPNAYIGQTYSDEVEWMKSWIQERIAWIDSQMVQPPRFGNEGASGSSSGKLSIQAADGTIYYTTDGTDPRQPGGAVSPKAQEYSEPLQLTPGQKVFARSHSGNRWSGPAVATAPASKSAQP